MLSRTPLLLLLLAALAPATLPASGQEGELEVRDASDTEGDGAPSYIIGKEDILQVSVYGEDDLSLGQVPVRPDGKISLPLLGDIMAAGETPEGLGHKLTELYRVHVRAPSVTVIVVEVNSFKVYMMGKVASPGEYTFGRETRLLQALAQAGGFADFANTKRIVLIREEDGAQRRIEINYEKIVSGESMDMNLRLKPGDTLVIN